MLYHNKIEKRLNESFVKGLNSLSLHKKEITKEQIDYFKELGYIVKRKDKTLIISR